MNSGQPRNTTTFDVVAPTAAELAAAEAELQAIGAAEPLPAAAIERLLRAPFAEASCTTPRRPIARTVALAAIVLLAVSGIAWAGMRVVWPVQQNSATTLPLADAIVLATEPNRDDLARRSAFGVMFDHSCHVADALAVAVADGDFTVTAAAKAVCADLLQRLHQVPTTPATPVTTDAVALAARIQDRGLATAERVQAIEDARHLITNCLSAANAARFTTTEGERFRAAALEQIGELLAR